MTLRCAVVGLAAVALAGSSCAQDPDDEVCAAVVSYGEPSLTIDSVTGADGRAVPAVALRRIREDGRPVTQDLRFMVRQGGSYRPGWDTTDALAQFGLEALPRLPLVCRVPCGFGTSSGRVTFEVSPLAGSFQPYRVDAGYTSSDDTCEGTLRGGTHVDLHLGG